MFADPARAHRQPVIRILALALAAALHAAAPASEVSLYVTVEQDGALVQGLQKRNFGVYEDGEPRPFRLEPPETPASSEREVPVTLGELPSQSSVPAEAAAGAAALQGLSVDELTPQIAGQAGVPRGTRGVVVSDVQAGSAAAEAGLRRGDVIQEVNRQTVASVAEFDRAVRAAGSQTVLLLVNRGGNTIYVTVEPR
jgi:membrane-associated protease RseP (regulator of RpoE activity)